MILLNGVRQAGLREIPAWQMAAQNGTTEWIRQVGQMLAEQQVKIDQLEVDAAYKLGAAISATRRRSSRASSRRWAWRWRTRA
jgi:hypothetical protein